MMMCICVKQLLTAVIAASLTMFVDPASGLFTPVGLVSPANHPSMHQL